MIKPREPELLERWKQLDLELDHTTREIKEGADVSKMMPRIRNLEKAVIALARKILDEDSTGNRNEEIEASIANLESVFSIFKTRLDELEMRADDPDVWIQVEPETLKQQFKDVFTAIAKNSKGGYEIHFDLAQKEAGDYYFDLKLEVQPNGANLWIPLRLIDVLRDLTANARKYTAPGGKVALHVAQDDRNIHAIIEDTGCGIPAEEVEKVAEFGYRASNARQRPTQGGGFGLTKAAWLVTTWGGSLTIQSELDAGTIISLSVPNKELPANPQILGE